MSGIPTRSNPRQVADALGTDMRDALGTLRRMLVNLTEDALWRVIGHWLPDGTQESRDAEVFLGIGFHARPSADGNAEALVAFPAGADNPIVIAARDEVSRAAVAGEVGAGETAMFSTGGTPAMVYAKSDGTVEVRLPGGACFPLALKSDVDNLAGHFAVHTHPTTPNGPISPPSNAGTTPVAVGTLVLKGG